MKLKSLEADYSAAASLLNKAQQRYAGVYIRVTACALDMCHDARSCL